MSNNPSTHNDREANTWMGRRGYDEAKYYRDETYGPDGEQSDERIRQKVLETYSRNTMLSMTDIHVEVSDGLVTLTGVVQGHSEKKEAADAIYNLTGVKAVRNQLEY